MHHRFAPLVLAVLAASASAADYHGTIADLRVLPATLGEGWEGGANSVVIEDLAQPQPDPVRQQVQKTTEGWGLARLGEIVYQRPADVLNVVTIRCFEFRDAAACDAWFAAKAAAGWKDLARSERSGWTILEDREHLAQVRRCGNVVLSGMQTTTGDCAGRWVDLERAMTVTAGRAAAP